MWEMTLLSALALSSTSSPSCFDLESLPSLIEIRQAVHITEHRPSTGLTKERLRVRHALPMIEVSFGSDVDENFRWVTNRAATEIQGRELGFRIRARWSLSSLISDSDEFRLFREERARELIRNQVIESIFGRVRRLKELLAMPSTTLRRAKIQFLCERLDLDTNGLFLRKPKQ